MVHCLNTKTGDPHWTYMTRARVGSSPAVDGDRIAIGSIEAIPGANGQRRTPEEIRQRPAEVIALILADQQSAVDSGSPSA